MNRYLALFFALLLASVAPRTGTAQEPEPADPAGHDTLSVVTLNIWHDQQDWPERLNLIVEGMEELRPDVILLQEVLQNPDLPNQAATLAYRLGYEDYHFVSFDPEDAPKRYGNAILSRHSIVERGMRKLEPKSDYRVAAFARIDVDGRPVSVYSTHLHHSGEGTEIRRQQIDDLLRFVDQTRGDAPAVIGGDFNAPSDAPELEPLRARFGDAFERVARRAEADPAEVTTLNPAAGHEPRRIDHIYSTAELAPAAARIVFDEPGPDDLWTSDHFGVLAHLTFEPQDFLDDLQERTFRWFWEETPADNGLTPDRAPSRPFASIAAVGFALPTYAIGAERGYIPRDSAAARTLNTLEFFWSAPQDTASSGISGYKGFFYHFLDMETGERFQTNELSTIDTALLMAGVVFAGEYYDRDDERESQIRAYADSLYRRVEWDWFQREDGLITMAWRPERGYGPAAYQGYDEAMILYLLALGSPTHPIHPRAWDAFTSTYDWADFYGFEHVNFAPLFGHQYSHMFVDYRGIFDEYMRERGIDYFENSRRATYAQREYGIDNPNGFQDYSGDVWGWTASDGPAGTWGVVNGDSVQFHTYWARGVAAGDIRDDGTVVPTAAGGSIPFAPEITIPALKHIRDRYGDLVYNEYGFTDAFNPSYRIEFGEPQRGVVDEEHGWFDGDQLGIDQGPIIIMLENYRSGLVWDVMRRSDALVLGLCRAGFTGGWLDGRCPE